ncbi:hypothetical protein F4U02_13750 [Acinetobacter haemolyticus]|uniref:hypothetical protein n=2 Tax=Acinetobacter haemolyticus TaxID=29430 RepID=UPI000F756084|nr:hypothetical protein [Acinetobacter haemolyticus]AZN67229.1 hypothetical protein DX910_01805 [Acinetobacter haemolyticus]MQZ32049.1 hypothetical protein [Acinetobacter haemolyticus]WPO66802.1 hypothetical protein SDC64_12885 [Acinetobacter haemolyticus]
MKVNEIFEQYLEIWEDCYFGYLCIPNTSNKVNYQSFELVISQRSSYNFFPWLNCYEEIVLPKMGLYEVSINDFDKLFMLMANEAINYGSDKRLEELELKNILDAFHKDFSNPRYYSNFTSNTWVSLTYHAQDKFLCAFDKNKIGMWLSSNDE